MTVNSESSAPTLDPIVITPVLSRRPRRTPNYAREVQALRRLARLVSGNPERLLQQVLDLALELCGADSSGVSMVETDESGALVFRWAAAAGRLASYAGGTKPRDFSPCGVCLDRGSPQLFLRPGQTYTYLQSHGLPEIWEALVIELDHGKDELGTIWIAAHEPDRHFDREDVRILTDIATFAGAAIRIQRLRSQSDAENNAKDDLLLKVSHELRQPVQTTLGWIDMLRRGAVASSKIGVAYDAIYDSAQSQAQLVSDLVDLSQLATGTLRVEHEAIDVCALVESLVASLTPLSLARQVAVKCELERPVQFAFADRQRVRQIMINLVLNAIKFTPEAGAVTVRVADHGPHVEIAVHDTGIGVPPDFLGSMFGAFQQSAHRISGRERGMGIGLTIVKELVKACGGSITAISDGIGKGTTMVVQLPVAAIDDAS